MAWLRSGSPSEDGVVTYSQISIVTGVGRGEESMKYEGLDFEESN